VMLSIGAMTVDATGRPSHGHPAMTSVRIRSGGRTNLYGGLSRRMRISPADPIRHRILISLLDPMSRRIRKSSTALMIHRAQASPVPMGCRRTTRTWPQDQTDRSIRTNLLFPINRSIRPSLRRHTRMNRRRIDRSNRRPDTMLRNLARNRKSRQSRARAYLSTAAHRRVGRCILPGRTSRISRYRQSRESQNMQDKPQLVATVAMT
jgi:hypothetical protein